MLAGVVARLRSFWRGIRRRPDVEAEMTEEFRSHLELRAADLVYTGLSPSEARRQARLEFGALEQYKDQGREARGLRRVDTIRFSWLDFKLGFRMLVRYPGLTLVGGLAIAFGIWVGAGVFEFISQVVAPTIPLPQGDRIVTLQNWNAAESRVESRSLHDFATWRRELRSVEEVGAYRPLVRNLIAGQGIGAPVEVAEISAVAFRLTRVPAFLGRTLIDADEHVGAAPVVVIGYDVWQSRFAGDSNIVGRTVRLSGETATVVGVMPPGYAFPVAHSVWTPLRINPLDYELLEGPGIKVFARLAPGFGIDEAQVELTSLGRRLQHDLPLVRQHLRPQVKPYAKSFLDVQARVTLAIMSSNLVVVLLVALICANVALLLFARAAARESELVVRTALGASRGRIISQLFAEALVLGVVAAVAGLAAARSGLRWGLQMAEAEMTNGGRLPFWFDGELSPRTVLYAACLTLFAAVIAGVVPAIKITRGVNARLKEATAGGGGVRFGGLWTAVIVIQVAVTVAFPAVAFFVKQDANRIETLDPGFPAQEYLGVRLAMDWEASASPPNDTSHAAFRARLIASHNELQRRLVAEPAIAGLTYASRLPRQYHPWNQIEVDEGAVLPPAEWGHRVSSVHVDLRYFDVLRAPILSGRGFSSGDLQPDARTVIVNSVFVDRVLGGKNPLGRRIRYVASESSRIPRSDGPWYEIVGVARDLGMTSGYGRAGIYHPIAAGSLPLHLALHVRGDPESFVTRLRELATAVDPTLRLHAVMPLDEVVDAELRFLAFWFQLTVIVSCVAMLLSLSGIYAVMSFAVSRRTREIGIRMALGAERRRILGAIFRRPLSQVGLGVLAGGVLIVFLGGTTVRISSMSLAIVAGYSVLMMGVCLLACIVPTRRALRVQPTDALRADG